MATVSYETPLRLNTYAKTRSYAGLPGGYVASIVWQETPFFGAESRGKDLLRWVAKVHKADNTDAEQNARFTKLKQAEQWLEWQIEDLKVLYPEG
jgi:hypothetical protein